MKTPRGPLPVAWIVAAAWAMLVAANVLLQQSVGLQTTTCVFRHATDLPCPTCGGTRAAIALAEGQPIRATMSNPLVTMGLIGLPVWLVVRRVRPADTRPVSGRVLAVFLALILANWVYLLATSL